MRCKGKTEQFLFQGMVLVTQMFKWHECNELLLLRSCVHIFDDEIVNLPSAHLCNISTEKRALAENKSLCCINYGER